jgi:hypothetical protein
MGFFTRNNEPSDQSRGKEIRDKQWGFTREPEQGTNINGRTTIMNKNHENKLTMYMGVASVLGENSSKTATLPALEESITKFGNVIGAIERKAKEIDAVATGKTVLKTECEDQLMDDLMPAVSALSAYAHTTGETVLAVKSNVSETGIRRLRDTEIIAKATGLMELVEANVEKLKDYGVMGATVTTIRNRIDAFTDALGKKKSGFSDRSSMRKSLFDLFDEADFLLTRQIDSMMEQFRKKETEFYNSYFQARFIKMMGAPRKAKAPTPLAQPAN